MRSFFSKKHPSTHDALRKFVCAICAMVLVMGAAYCADWYLNRQRVRQLSEKYSEMYSPAATAVASPLPSEPVPSPEPISTSTLLPEVLDVPIATPDSSTLVYAMPTPPPVQGSFSALLDVNPETVGFLRIGKIVDLPVVQRENNNAYYLTHNFSGEESSEGALFLDGLNRLVPEDDCLIVYGHNMNNGTMFGNLRSYLNLTFFRSHASVSFDTLYENRTYVPFAAFNASMDDSGRNAFDLRHFAMDAAEFDDFIDSLRTHSEFSVPLDVAYGDRLLLLVTCDYSNQDGRFILALRALRDGESVEAAAEKVAQAKQR